MKIINTLVFHMLITTSLLCNIGCAQKNSPSVEETIDQLEKSFKMRSIQFIEPSLSDEFTFNTLEPLFSKQILAALINNLPVKRIKNREIVSQNNDTLFMKCDLVIDKYLGMFSQPIDLVLLNGKEKTYIIQLILDDTSISVTVENDSVSAEKQLYLKDYSKVESKTIATYYDEGLGNIANEINKKQEKGIEIVENILNEQLIFKIGLLLLNDSLNNANIDQPVIPVPILTANYENDTTTSFFINWAYFHELVEAHLAYGKNITNPDTRWFRDGLADYISHKVAQELNPQIDSIMMQRRMNSYDDIGRKADLLTWIGTGNMTKKASGIEGGSGQYAAAMLFFIDLTDEYGEEIIPQIMEALKKHKDITSKILIKEISKITGTDIKKVLEKY